MILPLNLTGIIFIFITAFTYHLLYTPDSLFIFEYTIETGSIQDDDDGIPFF